MPVGRADPNRRRLQRRGAAGHHAAGISGGHQVGGVAVWMRGSAVRAAVACVGMGSSGWGWCAAAKGCVPACGWRAGVCFLAGTGHRITHTHTPLTASVGVCRPPLAWHVHCAASLTGHVVTNQARRKCRQPIPMPLWRPAMSLVPRGPLQRAAPHGPTPASTLVAPASRRPARGPLSSPLVLTPAATLAAPRATSRAACPPAGATAAAGARRRRRRPGAPPAAPTARRTTTAAA